MKRNFDMNFLTTKPVLALDKDCSINVSRKTYVEDWAVYPTGSNCYSCTYVAKLCNGTE
jgi:hypothetical protein